ncbi:MAG: hypothetical protein CMN31_24185 [Sandaracinus sp.]|nr:hypothetical protein [Myxococcales bacterium]MBJ74389.1 hypothetical protein [Sandaracinus sp.]
MTIRTCRSSCVRCTRYVSVSPSWSPSSGGASSAAVGSARSSEPASPAGSSSPAASLPAVASGPSPPLPPPPGSPHATRARRASHDVSLITSILPDLGVPDRPAPGQRRFDASPRPRGILAPMSGENEGGWRGLLRDPDVVVPASVLLGLLLWGPEGDPWLLDFDAFGWPAHRAWMARFAWGALFVVAVPIAALKLWARPAGRRRSLAAWGLGLGRWRRGLPWGLGLAIAGALVMVFFTSKDPTMQAEYPLYGHEPLPTGELVAYEASYLLFFLCGEAGWRGLLLFGLRDALLGDRDDASARLRAGAQAVLWTTFIQLVWHLDKPTAELALAPVWGLLVGAASLRLGSVWYMLLFHWVSNVALDLAILARVG